MFSWEHPWYRKVTLENNTLILTGNLFEEKEVRHNWLNSGTDITVEYPNISHWVNLLSSAGFINIKVFECKANTPFEKAGDLGPYYPYEKITKVPVTIVLYAEK